MNVRKIVATVAIVMSLMAQTAGAQTSEFKKEWTKIFNNVYYKTQTLVDKLPSGETEFRVFGFKDKQEVPADIVISGNVTDVRRFPKGYKFIMKSSRFNYESGDTIIKFNGAMNLSISDGQVKGKVTMMITPVDGTWSKKISKDKDFVNYHVMSAWEEQVGWFTVNIGKPAKGEATPVLTTVNSDLRLPRQVTKKVKYSPELAKLLGRGKLPLSKADSIFLHSVLTKGSKIEKVPEIEAVVGEMPMKNDPSKVFDTELLYYKVGNKLKLSDADISRSGSDYTIIYHGSEPRYNFTATYTNSKSPEFTNVKWEDGSEFANNELLRSDKSRITSIGFDIKENVLDMPRGFVVSQALVLSDLTDPDIFELSKYSEDAGLGKFSVGSYISPDNVSELIADDMCIKAVKKRVEEERARALAEYQKAKDLYDQAQEWLSNRSNELASEYEAFSTGREVFEIPNNQDAEPHNVKVYRQIMRKDAEDGFVYDEELYVYDESGSYPIQIDIDGDACFTVNDRTYWFTQFSEEAIKYLDTYRIAKQFEAALKAGEPVKPNFD